MTEQEDEGLSRDEIRRSGLNRLSLKEIDDQYSSKSVADRQTKIDEKFIPVLAIGGTLIVMLVVGLGSFLIYSLMFGPSNVEKKVADDSNEISDQEYSSQVNFDDQAALNDFSGGSSSSGQGGSQNQYCSPGSKVPDQVCQAILSVQDDTSANNTFLSTNAVTQLEPLPDGVLITIDESTWTPVGSDSGTIEVDAVVPNLAELRAEVSMVRQAGRWIVSSLVIL